MNRLSLAGLVCFMTGCAQRPPEPQFGKMAEEFVYSSLALSPVTATAAGYHVHGNARLDELLDDLSPSGIERQRGFYNDFRTRLGRVDAAKLPPEDRADYDIIQDQISLQLLELDRIQSYRHNPTIYVELIGNALFNPHVLEYAPREQRIGHIIARLKAVPKLLQDARTNLSDAPPVWTRVAREENDGNIGLIDKTIRASVPEPLRAGYDEAAAAALNALRGFQSYLESDLSRRAQHDWRLGKELYAAKFRHYLQTDLTPEQVLERAEADLERVRAGMRETAARILGPKAAAGDPVVAALDRVARRHATPATYMSEARRDLEEARQFVGSKHLLTLPSRDNLRVIDTPEFMRGVYAVGGFAPAPALEPHLGAFYWVTPIPESWPAPRVESKLREYNFYKLKLLTIHEAMPGHYVQLEFANDVQPQSRRVLRSVFGNNAYIEGWAQYATQVLIDEGFQNGAPELLLTFQKEELRVLANAIIDIRLQSMGMTEQEALDLMLGKTYQEKEEATAKLQRAQLSSCQLPTYLVGWRDWIRVRAQYRAEKGGEFRLSDFHDRALKEGSVPLPLLARLLTGKPLSSR